MAYCIDTSALIDLGERHYPERLAVFKPIWSRVHQDIADGNLVSVDPVRDELQAKADDWRDEFLVQANNMFHLDATIEAEYASIVASIESKKELFNANKHRERFMSGADPWVIALASRMDYTVISAETKKLSDYGLGAVCNELGIRHINLVSYFEISKIGIV